MRAYDRSPSSVEEDFEFFKAHYVDGVRIFPNWWADCGWDGGDCDVENHPGDSLMDSDGNLRSSRLAVLKNLIALAASEGLVVDLSFAREVPGSLSVSDFQDGLADAAYELSSYRNVMFDIQNERDLSYSDMHLSLSEVSSIRAAIKVVDADRIVMASSTETTGAAGTAQFQLDGGLDVAAYHDPRYPSSSTWYDQVDDVINTMWNVDPWDIVVYLQEPQAWQDDSNASHYLTAAHASKHWGAAAWLFHTRTGFDLSDHSFVYKITHQSNGTPGEDGQMDVFDGIRDDLNWENWSACNFDLSTYSQSVPASGGTYSVHLSSRWWCAWNAFTETGGASWVIFPGATQGTDPSGFAWGGYDVTVSYSVAPNYGGSRTAVLRIGTVPLTVTQAAY